MTIGNAWHRTASLVKSVYTSPTRFFIVHALIFGLGVVIFLPPFQGADEPSHFARAYQISEGNLVEDQTPIGVGGLLPASLPKAYFRPFYLIGQSNLKFTKIAAKDIWATQLNPNQKSLQDIRTTATYAPTAYAPQAIVILIGRLFSLRPVLLLYLARLSGLLVFVVAGYWAVRIMPNRKWLFVLLLCLPMSLFGSATLTADTVIRSAVILLIALVFLIKQKPKLLDNPLTMLAIAGLSLTIAVSKEVYLPLALLPVMLMWDSHVYKERKRFFGIVLITILTILAWGAWLYIVHKLNVPPINLGLIATPPTIISNVIHNIPQYGAVNLNSLLTYNSNGYVVSFVGNFGWLDTPLPFWMVVSFYGILGIYALQTVPVRVVLALKEKLTVIVLAFASIALVFAALYVYWTIPVMTYVDGLQGRYFWPIVIVAVQALPAGLLVFKTHKFKVAYSVLILFSMLVFLYRYYPLDSPFLHKYQDASGSFVEITKFKNAN